MDIPRMIDAARACVGTPFCHQGRAPGAGLDCIGLVICALRAGGMEGLRDRRNYSRLPEPGALRRALETHGFAQAGGPEEAGDILLFRFNRAPQHVALAAGAGRMIHAYAPLGRVVECAIGPGWRRRLVGIWRLSAR